MHIKQDFFSFDINKSVVCGKIIRSFGSTNYSYVDPRLRFITQLWGCVCDHVCDAMP